MSCFFVWAKERIKVSINEDNEQPPSTPNSVAQDTRTVIVDYIFLLRRSSQVPYLQNGRSYCRHSVTVVT